MFRIMKTHDGYRGRSPLNTKKVEQFFDFDENFTDVFYHDSKYFLNFLLIMKKKTSSFWRFFWKRLNKYIPKRNCMYTGSTTPSWSNSIQLHDQNNISEGGWTWITSSITVAECGYDDAKFSDLNWIDWKILSSCIAVNFVLFHVD